MEFGRQQNDALLRVNHWLQHRSKEQQVFRLFGYAGTGKTTIAKHLVENIHGDVFFAAYTNKAALELRKKGCPNPVTCHQLIYTPAGNNTTTYKDLRKQLSELIAKLEKEGATKEQVQNDRQVKRLTELATEAEKEAKRPRFSLNLDSPLRHAELVVIDEGSFIDVKMGEDLESFNKPILVLGDPAQLPPVKGFGHFIHDDPDFLLTDIHRQAKDNPIIHLATLAREQRNIPLGRYRESSVIPKYLLREKPDIATNADQIICGLNKTRIAGNNRIRSLRGYNSALPEPGEKLICLTNKKEEGLFNGGLWQMVDYHHADGDDVFYANLKSLDIDYDIQDVPICAKKFITNEAEEAPFYNTDIMKFTYGYLLTGHKLQGSQADDVLLIDESAAFRQDKWKHLYTCITRAAERITIAVD